MLDIRERVQKYGAEAKEKGLKVEEAELNVTKLVWAKIEKLRKENPDILSPGYSLCRSVTS